jgi:hypothetical protein
MSVCACGRARCESIMCTRLVLDGHAYICGECFEELEQHKEDWPERLSVAQAKLRVSQFMQTEPGTYLKSGPRMLSRDEAFEAVTGDEHEW